MNLNEYIESGIIELYVLGLLKKEELTETIAMITKWPQLAQEVAEVEMALVIYSQNLYPGLNPSLKENLLNKIDSRNFNGE